MQAEYLQIAGSDVEIILSPARRLNVTRETLIRNSTRFAKILAIDQAAKLDRKTIKSGFLTRYRVVLYRNANFDPDRLDYSTEADGDLGPEYQLTAVELNEKGRAVDWARDSRNSLGYENGLDIPKIFQDYERVIGSFYNKQFELNQTNLATILVNAGGVIDLAEYLGCTSIISKTIDLSLVSEGQTLYRSIAAHPENWINLGYRISSRMIFREALIHAVGQSSTINPDDIGEGARNVYLRKLNDIEKMKTEVNKNLVAYFPATLQKEDKSGGLVNGRSKSEYGEDVFAWMALSFYKHWMSLSFIQGSTDEKRAHGFEFYNKISKGGEAYLSQEQVLEFNQLFPMTFKGKRVFADHLSSIKEEVRAFVAPLMRNCSQLDTHNYPVSSLACTEVTEEDFPWITRKESVVDDEDSTGEESSGMSFE
ncbi:hypothetical protein LTR50_004035 [Elasticomyces elasticus]|nr:hypothetical protein LTR50_004035 [Elasticomyces elasticus]